MAKTKKKRTKRYAGTGAAAGPVVRRYEAVDRGRLAQWAYERKGRIRIFGILALIVGLATLIVTGVSGLFR